LVLKAVLAIFGNRDESWNSMRNFLPTCKNKILNFDIRDVSDQMRNDAEVIITENANEFRRERIFQASQDAAPLADWVKATIEYSKTYERVRPLEENLQKIEQELKRSRVRYEECRRKVAESEQKIKELN
jgi:dynein heavy chain 2